MSVRPVSNPFRQSILSKPIVCSACRCSCGQAWPSKFAVLGITPVQHRNKYAPAVRRQKRVVPVNEPVGLRATELAKLNAMLAGHSALGRFGVKLPQVMKFTEDLIELAEKSKRMDLQDGFEKLRVGYSLKEKDCIRLFNILQKSDYRLYRLAGFKMLHSLASQGHRLAVVLLLKSMLLKQKAGVNELHVADVEKPRAHLRDLAQRGSYLEAMVLEGQIQHALNHTEQAVKLWDDAIPLALDRAKQNVNTKRPQKFGPADNEDEEKGERFYDLESPWIELANLHSIRGQDDLALQAIEWGIQADDPISHYQRAQYAKAPTEVVGSTSAWLYHTTKAASSGHAKAAHELGLFYAMTGWKYIEDEPPDEIKPTPFDSYPQDAQVKSRSTPWMERLQMAVGLRSSSTSIDPVHQMFQSAAFPTSLEHRATMALLWFDVAMKMTYAPSFLASARLRLAKTLWSRSQTPEAALKLSSDRYDYLNHHDYINGIKKRGTKLQPDEDPPNPFYDPAIAKELIREVLYASRALAHRQRVGTNILEMKRDDASWKTAVKSESFDIVAHGILPSRYAEYFRYPDIRKMYSDDVKGVLFDSSQGIPDLRLEAFYICEQQGWDIYDQDNGSLMYKHGLRTAPTGPQPQQKTDTRDI